MFAFIDSVPLLSQINCRLEAPSTLPNVSEQMRLRHPMSPISSCTKSI